jgi:probable HAF family extracellular repeat protein
VIGQLPTDPFASNHNSLNNLAPAQVVGQDVNDRAYLWDSTHGTQELGTVGKDMDSTATGINGSGDVVGYSYTETFKVDRYGFPYVVYTSFHAFLWTSANGIKNIGNNHIATGVNASGEVIGTLNGLTFVNQQAGLWNGSWTGLGTLGGSGSEGFGINDYGQAVGMSYIAAPTGYIIGHAFLWTPATPGSTKGTMIDLGALNNTLGFDTSIASAINAQGIVTGQTVISNTGWSHAFVWSPTTPNGTKGTMNDLGALDGVYSQGTSINSSGTVVGQSTDGSAGWHAVLWQRGMGGNYTMTDLNNLIPSGSGWTLSNATAINDAGQIVVEAQGSSGAFTLLLTPSTTTPALALPATSTAMTNPSGPLIASSGQMSVAPILASPQWGSIRFDVTAASVIQSLSQAPPTPAAPPTPPLPFSPTPLTGPSHSNDLSPVGSPQRLWHAQPAVVDRVFVNLDVELSLPLVVDDMA